VRDIFLASTAELAAPLRGLRVLLFGFSGKGFPGGDGVAEAVETLPGLGIEATYAHLEDADIHAKLAGTFDVAIICNTRIGSLLAAPRDLWKPAAKRALWFWDLRPGSVGAPLAGLVDHVFLSYLGRWRAPGGDVYDPEQWASALRCPVSYCPQGAPLRDPVRDPSETRRVVFVGDLANPTYHYGRRELCRQLGAAVVNEKDRSKRLAVEATMPALYRSARYVLSASPLAPGYTSVRTYSVLACGGLMLLHRFPESDRLFDDGKHALLFDSPGELAERLEALDGDPAARDAIADAGRALHASKHTVTHRILSICRRLTGVSTEFDGWL